jgi:hypothetical protein
LSAEGSAKFYYYGIAQFEIEVIYSALNVVFGRVDEQQLPIEDTQYVSMVEIEFPIPFGESFFQKFSMERWHKIKGLLKEMRYALPSVIVSLVMKPEHAIHSFS